VWNILVARVVERRPVMVHKVGSANADADADAVADTEGAERRPAGWRWRSLHRRVRLTCTFLEVIRGGVIVGV
jgi:hypothetical protein